MLYNILRNRLKKRVNKKYSEWMFNRKKFNGENHHLLKSFVGGKKQNDLLQCEITPEYHKTITYVREPTEQEFIDMLIPALDSVFDYVEYLQQIIKDKNK